MKIDKSDNYLNGYCEGRTELLKEMLDHAPVAWMYERARYGPTDLRGQQWRPELSRLKPYEGNGMVRDVTPLYTSPPRREPLTPQSPCEMTQAEYKIFKLGWLECESAHGIRGKA